MSFKDILFGEKKFVETEIVGTFHARIRKKNNSKAITWTSTIRIDNYSDEIVILLEGDSFGPAKVQVESATWIIQNIKGIENELLTEINRDLKLSDKFKNKNLNDLRLSCLNPWDISFNNYELSFESKSDESFAISAIIQNQKIVEIE